MMTFLRRLASVRRSNPPGPIGVRRRPGRSFRPGASADRRLENRALLSGDVRMVVQPNLPYPTPAGPPEQLDIYTPSRPAPPGGWPVIVAIHGGGWRRLSKDEYGPRIASAFVPNGYVVVAPNYALSGRGRPSWPTNLDDLRSVVSWIRTEAPALQVAPNQIVAMGESAGGNLAELLGTDPGTSASAVDAVIAFSGPSDLVRLHAASPLAGLAAAQFLGGLPRQIPSEYAAASPIDHVAPGDPPMFLVHGRQDPLVPVGQSREMARALASAGVSHQLVLVNGGHALDFPVHYGDLTRRLLEFLAATWNDKGNLSRIP